MKDRKGRSRKIYYHDLHAHTGNSHVLRSLQAGRLTTFQIEASRKIIAKIMKRIGTYKVHVKPVIGVSRKPAEVRMGKGKGAVDHYVSRIKAGQLLFSIQSNSVDNEVAKTIFKKAQYKLPVKTIIMHKK